MVREAKSQSAETTFDVDVREPAELEVSMSGLAEELCRRLRSRDLEGRTIGIKVRLDDWTNVDPRPDSCSADQRPRGGRLGGPRPAPRLRPASPREAARRSRRILRVGDRRSRDDRRTGPAPARSFGLTLPSVCEDCRVADDRLSGLDSSFLHMERAGCPHARRLDDHLRGPGPDATRSSATTSPRACTWCRASARSCASVPFGQGRPVWVDDPHLNLDYHVRQTALPAPGSEEQLRNLAARIFSQQLDRTKPLWELWLVEGHGATGVSR